jgi:hypothetical protein
LGDDVAIAISVSADIVDDVRRYVETSALPIGKLINISPLDGPGQAAVADPSHAVGLSHALLDEIRRHTRESAGIVHLFLCAPNGIGVLLGHLWNRVPTTQLYEDANAPSGYFPTFRFER